MLEGNPMETSRDFPERCSYGIGGDWDDPVAAVCAGLFPSGCRGNSHRLCPQSDRLLDDAASGAAIPGSGGREQRVAAGGGSVGFLGIGGQVVMMSFLVFFLLASGDLFKRKLVRVLGNALSEKRVTLKGINEVSAQIERFLLIRIATSVLVGVCTSFALWMLGVGQSAVWGVAAGVLNSIPYFGAILATAGLALVAFVQFGSLMMALQVSGVALAITSLEGYLLTPWLMGRAARINGAAMFIGLLFWSWLWRVAGMIVAVPLMMVLKSVCDRVERLQPVGELLGE